MRGVDRPAGGSQDDDALAAADAGFHVVVRLDGDMEGATSRFSAEVEPGALLVMAPR